MIKLYALYGGDIICRDISQLNKGLDVSGEIELANPVFLIDHPNGRLIWDSGLPDTLIQQKEGIENWIFHLSMKRSLISQLEEIGLTPNDIDYFALSHTHNDHTGNANYFKQSTLIMQKSEYAKAFEAEEKPYNYHEIEGLKESKVLKLNGDYDLFGDSSVQFISTPGHTVGHQSLLIQLEDEGPVIISGDISYYEDNYHRRGIPNFNWDADESLKSIEKIQKLKEELGAQLWIQHDKESFDNLKLSPEYYH